MNDIAITMPRSPKSVAIMQPYIFPYIGYYQLIAAVDVFVEYDDVDFITRGYVNRNNILINNERALFTIPVKKASQNKKINEIDVVQGNKELRKLLKTIQHSYSKAPYFEAVYPMIENILMSEYSNLSEFLHYSLVQTCNYLDIETELLRSSNIENDKSNPAEQRLIDITKMLDGGIYINAYGGYENGLYTSKAFEDDGLKLKFIKSNIMPYSQFGADFVSHLSIIDVMMFNSPKDIQEQLNNYELIEDKE